jgi:hypothetical protein
MDLRVPEPGRAERRSYKLHEGFYLRGNVGLGTLYADYGEPSGNSSSLALDLMVGAMPSPGFALGGALLTDTLLNADLGADVGQTNVTLGIVGPFVDGFPDPKGGWHLGGAAGLAVNSVEDVGSGTFIGFGGAGWGGYDFWAGDEWSVGLMARVMATRTWSSEDDATGNSGGLDGSTRSFSLLVTGLFN